MLWESTHVPGHPLNRHLLFAFLAVLPLIAAGQTLTIDNAAHTYASLANTTVNLTGHAELRITGSGDPIPGCTIHLNSEDAWFYMPNIQPQALVTGFLSRIRVDGAAAVLNTNVRVVQYGMGAVVIPHGANFSPLQVFDSRHFTGKSKVLHQYLAYDDLTLGEMKGAIRSFKLKHGYTATLAANPNGTGVSRNYVAQDGDLEVGRLPEGLDQHVGFVRVFPWRWVSKKGIAGNIEQYLNIRWLYDWDLDRSSPLNWEYVPIKHTRSLPSLADDWKSRGANHLLGFNEPDHPDQANMTVAEAIAGWPELLGTGLRLGAPAITDGGIAWLTDFMAKADAAGLRVDFVPVHYYRSYSNPADPAGATTQFYNFLKGIYDIVKRPLWVTEFNNGANWTTDPDPTVAQEAATVAAMIEMLDSTPFVERYSLFNWVEDVRNVIRADGSLTLAGVAYRDNASPISYLQEMPDAGIGAFANYSFDGDAHDSSGNGQDGMLVGTPTFIPGKYGHALALNGNSDYVQLSPRLADGTGFSFAAWIYWNGGASEQRIFGFGGPQPNALTLTPQSASNTMRFTIRKGGAEQQLNAPPLPTGAWTHVAVTITRDTGKLFINGTLANTNPAISINPFDVGTKYNYLAKSQSAADPLFNGSIDDVRIFSSALTDAQIAAIASMPPPHFSNRTLLKPSGVELQPYTGSIATDATGGVGSRIIQKMGGPAWLAVAQDGRLTGVPTSADIGVNTFLVRVTDSIGSNHTATLQIGVSEPAGLVARYSFESNTNSSVGDAHGLTTGSPNYVAGQNGTSIDLDGADDFITFPGSLAGSSEMTIAAWVNWDGGANWQRIFDFGNGTGEYMFLSPKSGNNTLRFAIADGAIEQQLNSAELPTAQWSHVAVTLGSETGKLYVNGVLVNSAAITNTPSALRPATNYIGRSQFAADPLFNGRIDDFLIFNRALTGSEVVAIMNGRAPSFTVHPLSKPTATPGEGYNHSLALDATASDPGSTLAFSKVTGPAWLTVAADGRISGLPAASDTGTNQFIVRVTDQAGLADDAMLTITVSPASGLVTHYQFDGTLVNSNGSGAGIATGSPAYENGVFDRALLFDGSDDSVTLPPNIVGSLGDVTFAVRVRWNGGVPWQRIFDFGAGAGQYMMLTPSSGSGTLQFAILHSGGMPQRLSGPNPLPVGEWAHVAVTLEGSTGTLYVNGAAVATTTITTDPSAVAQTLNYLGKSQLTSDPLFAGSIDDLRIYNRGLSDAEVAALVLPAAPVAVPLDYTGWTKGVPFTVEQSDPPEDPDRDGLPNAFEFLMGFNPLSANSGVFPLPEVRTGAQLGIEGDPTRRYLTLQIRVRPTNPGTTLIAEAAPTILELALPAAAGHARQAGPSVPDGEFETLTYYYDVPIENSPTGSGVMRLRATMQ